MTLQGGPGYETHACGKWEVRLVWVSYLDPPYFPDFAGLPQKLSPLALVPPTRFRYPALYERYTVRAKTDCQKPRVDVGPGYGAAGGRRAREAGAGDRQSRSRGVELPPAGGRGQLAGPAGRCHRAISQGDWAHGRRIGRKAGRYPGKAGLQLRRVFCDLSGSPRPQHP